MSTLASGDAHEMKPKASMTASVKRRRDLEDGHKWMRVFTTLDTNGDGIVSVSELRDALVSVDRQKLNLTASEVDAILTATDKNHNGIVEYEEFVELMESNAQLSDSFYGRVVEKIGDTWIPMNARQYAREHYSCRPPPVFIASISLAQIIVYILFGIFDDEDPINGCPGCTMVVDNVTIAGPLTFIGYYRVLVWPFFTYAFLHSGISHIYGNIFLQLLVGVPLELVHKWRVIPLYVAGVVMGAMMCYLYDPNTMLVGASAGVFALVAAAIAQTIMNWSEMPEPWLRLLVAGGFLLNNVITTAVIQPLQSSKCSVVSWTAHLGGAITGFLFGVYILKNFTVRPWEVKLQRVCLALYLLLFLLLVIGVIVRQPGDESWHGCSKNNFNSTLSNTTNALSLVMNWQR